MGLAPRVYYVRGPDSGGVYFLEVRGDEVRHCGSGECAPDVTGDAARESVSTFLFANGANEGMADAVRDLRADLDGDYRVGVWKVRFERGRPLEARRVVACADAGRGGHTCSEACAGSLEVDEALGLVERMCGRALRVARHGLRDDPMERRISEGYVVFDEARPAVGPVAG